MPLLKATHKSLLIFALLAQAAGASTIIQSAGNSSASVPLGFYSPYAQFGMTPIVFAVGWTQSSDYTDIDVFANLFTPGSPGTVNFELVDAIGPGTSFAANGIIRGTAVTPSNPDNVDLFHLASLGAGTYYLVLDSPVANTSWQYNFPLQPNFTMANGVSYLGGSWSAGASINTNYTAGSSFSGVSYPVEFQVTGTAATPEPATLGGSGLALVGIAWLTGLARRRQNRS